MAYLLKRYRNMGAVIVGLLSIPLIAMQFTTEVNWTSFDFLIMGTLLASASILAERLTHFLKKKQQRLFAIATIGLVALLIWAELAVGIFNTPLAGS